ncbi:hypothetical protein CR513_42634, partial [Mucuna pruriens]
MDRSMIDAASGGALMDKTLVAVRHLISNMANNTQQFGIKGSNLSRSMNEIGVASNQRLENQLTELTSLVRQLAVSQHHPAMAAKVCGICTSMEHPTDLCPTLQETESGQTESVGALVDSSNLPSQTIPNPKGNASAVILTSGKELSQPAQHQMPKSAEADSEAIAGSQVHPEAAVPLSFPPWTISARKPDLEEELLKMFSKVEINIPLLYVIKQIPKYAKFLKELCVHKRRKMKGSREFGGVVSALTKSDSTVGISQVLPKKCRDPGIFSVRCTIGECIFPDAMLDLGALINVMSSSIYKSLNFGDLEPTGMTIQLANRSIVQPLEVLEDVLVQVNELIFPIDFYVLDMEDETSGKESTLILGRPFLMTARTKIDVHTETLSMEFDNTLVQFNIFEAMKHPTEDHSLFGIDRIEELVEEYFQLDSCSEEVEDFAGIAESSSCSKADYDEVQEFSDFEGDYSDVADLAFETKLTELLNQTDLSPVIETSPSLPPMELKPLPSHLKYAYLDSEQQFPVIIANNLLQEQEDKLLKVLRQHKKAIEWKLSDLPGINPSICMHRILMEEEIKPIRQ